MSRIFSCPSSKIPKSLEPDVTYICQYESSKRDDVGHMGIEVPRTLRSYSLAPSTATWDFATIAFAVDAADKAILRKDSADGWTRIIELTIRLNKPDLWEVNRKELESVLGFLTGDLWKLSFLSGGARPPKVNRHRRSMSDCVCLLSGGVDSLVGAIDLIANDRRPIFISQVARGSKATQRIYARTLGSEDYHFQWSFCSKHRGRSEQSTRGRSIVFLALAALSVSAVPSENAQPVEIIVPENGFISLNVPLGQGRLGSLSTKTTHPLYLEGIQTIWDNVGINAKLRTPLAFKTKGEAMLTCANPGMLSNLIQASVSCGKYGRHNLTHCGVCVPCMIRRAGFLKAGISDNTEKGYVFPRLSESNSKDVTVAATAYLRYKRDGIRRFTGSALLFADLNKRQEYEGVVVRGMEEIGNLLSRHGVI